MTASDDRERAEIAKIEAETRKIETETRFYPIVALGAFIAATVALGKLLAS